MADASDSVDFPATTDAAPAVDSRHETLPDDPKFFHIGSVVKMISGSCPMVVVETGYYRCGRVLKHRYDRQVRCEWMDSADRVQSRWMKVISLRRAGQQGKE